MLAPERVAAPPPEPPRHSFLARLLAAARNNFFAGVVVIAPIGLTVWLIWTVVGWVDDVVMPFVPRYYHPDAFLNRWLGIPRGSDEWIELDVRGVGVVVFLIVTFLVGWIAKGIVGRSVLRTGEDLLGRVPVVRPLYNGLKQVAETLFAQAEGPRFDRICLVEFPRKGLWSVAFIAGPARGEVRARLGERAMDDEIITLFRPMTPNATAGFLLFAHRSEVVELDMSLEDAAKLVISAGIVFPEEGQPADARVAAELGRAAE